MSQRIIDRSYVGEVLQRIYSSKLNARLEVSLHDGYFYMEYSRKRIPLHGTTIEEAVTDLGQHLAAEFPESQFAQWWQLNFRQENQPQS